MNARLFQEFRAMQLAVKGALNDKYKGANKLIIEGMISIELGDNAIIDEVCLDKDFVNVNIFNKNSYAPITCFSDEIVEEIVDTMRAKALDMAGLDVMVNFKGELAPNQLRY